MVRRTHPTKTVRGARPPIFEFGGSVDQAHILGFPANIYL